MANYQTYVPEFHIQLDGKNLPAALRGSIMSINYQDGLEGADRVEVTLTNENLQWLDHPLLQLDVPFILSIGYAPGPLQDVFFGEITGLNPSFPSSGMPTLTVVAQDFLHRLTTGKKDRAFQINIPTIGSFPIPDFGVVGLTSATNLLVPALDPVGAALSFLGFMLAYAIDPLEAKKAIRFQEGQSDFEFLSQIASENGWEMFIDHSAQPSGYVLRFKFLVQDYSPSVTLKWGQSLTEFTPRMTSVGQVFGISTRIWVPSIKVEFVIILSWDYDRAAFDLMVYPGFGSLEMLLGSNSQSTVQIDAISPALAPQRILSELLPRLNNRLTGTGSTIGNPRIKAGAVIKLDGLGDQFGGLYRITSATHTLDSSGYRTSFEVRKEVWFGSIPLPKGPGSLLRVQGQRIG